MLYAELSRKRVCSCSFGIITNGIKFIKGLFVLIIKNIYIYTYIWILLQCKYVHQSSCTISNDSTDRRVSNSALGAVVPRNAD